MAELASAFEEFLRGLTDSEWSELQKRVRTPAAPPESSQQRMNNEVDPGYLGDKPGVNAGLAEARRRGYLDNEKQART